MEKAPSSSLLALWRTVTLILGTLVLAVRTRWNLIGKDGEARDRVAAVYMQKWGRYTLRCLGIRSSIRGELPKGPCFLTPNHLGYLDTAAVAAAYPAIILSRKEIMGWPLVGSLLSMIDAPYVDREDPRSLPPAMKRLAGILRHGVSVCVFAEGTSTGGDTVLDFHAPLFRTPMETKVPAIPMAIKWTASDQRIDIAEDLAYWKDHVFGPHYWRMAGLRGLHVELRFGEEIGVYTDRKDLAQKARVAVLGLLES